MRGANADHRPKVRVPGTLGRTYQKRYYPLFVSLQKRARCTPISRRSWPKAGWLARLSRKWHKKSTQARLALSPKAETRPLAHHPRPVGSPRRQRQHGYLTPELSSSRYVRLEHAVRALVRLDRGTLMSKVDLESASLVVLMHPDDHNLLRMAWRDGVYLDTALPFGLRSAPKISAIADAFLWAMYDAGLPFGLHYLDDFFFAGRAHERSCHTDLSLALLTCARLGFDRRNGHGKGPGFRPRFPEHLTRFGGRVPPPARAQPGAPQGRAGASHALPGRLQARPPLRHWPATSRRHRQSPRAGVSAAPD